MINSPIKFNDTELGEVPIILDTDTDEQKADKEAKVAQTIESIDPDNNKQ